MVRFHSKDYKIVAIEHYLKYGSYRRTCLLFKCKKSSLFTWVKKYSKNGILNKKVRKTPYKKLDTKIITFIKNEISKSPNITLRQLSKLIKKNFNKDIHSSSLSRIIIKEGITRKLLRKRYYPLKKLDTLKQDLKTFYQTILKIKPNKLISIDETSIYINMTYNYGRAKKGKRAYLTTHIYPFKKYNLLCAITNEKVIGWVLYEKLEGGIKSKEFVDILNKFITNKYKGYTILLDNASFHKAKKIKDNIIDNKNKYLYTIPYNPETNPIEEFYSQLKHYIKLKSPQSYNEITILINKIISNKIKEENLKNYFKHLYLRAKKYA